MEFIKTQYIKFQHVDPAGIVFYPRWMEMLNELVEDWFNEALHYSFKDMHLDQEHGVPTVALNVLFKKPAYLGDVINKHLWVEKIGNSSLNCGFKFLNAHDDTCLEGTVSLVFVSQNKNDGSIKAAAWKESLTLLMKKYMHS